MAGCCGNSICSCRVEGGTSIEVLGTGTANNPYIVNYTGVPGDSPFFMPEQYVPEDLEDPVEDWRPYIQDAIDAAAICGGTVMLTGTYEWSGLILVKTGVWLMGTRSNGPNTNTVVCDTLRALDATSQIKVGSWATDDRPGGLVRLRINGNSTGVAAGLVSFEGVHAQVMDVYIYESAQHNMDLNAAQNITFIAVFSVFARNGAACRIRNGSGGLNFVGCHLVFSKTSLLVHDEDSYTGNAYPFGSAHINFFGGIMETHGAVPTTCIVDARATNNLHFFGTGFSQNSATPTSENCLIKITNPDFPIVSSVGFHNCNFNGGDNLIDIVKINGGNFVSFHGDNYYQKTTRFIHIFGDFPVVRCYGDFITGNDAGVFIGTSGGGGTVNVYEPHKTFLDFRMPDERPNILSTRREADGNVGLRMFITRDGTIAYSDGTDSAIHASISYVPSTEMIGISRLATSGRFGSIITSFSVTTAAEAVQIDSEQTSCHQFLLTAGSSIGSMSILNALQGTRLEIWVSQPPAGGATYAWPSNCRFHNNNPPSDTTGNTTTTVTFRYHQGAAKWIEVARSVAVPNV